MTKPTFAPAALAWLETHALFVAAASAVVILSLAGIPAHLSQDGWLALVAGRLIADHGIPHHDFLTVMAHGVRWIDQQWLAQLWMYGLQQLGGLALMTVFYVSLTGTAFAMAMAAARQLGAEDRHVIAMLPLGAFFYLATAVSIRTQGFAYPLFVATLWLLAAEARRPSARRVYLVFPILVVWANLHGSVTPYGTSIVSYYSATLLNPNFSKLVTEWEPVTSFTILAIPLLLLVIGTVWALGRSGRRTPAFEQILLAVLALGAIDAVRNITWFGLAVVILLPATITRLRPTRPAAPRRRRLNLTLAMGALALVLLGIVVTTARPTRWFESTYPARALTTVARLARQDPGAKVFADVRFADWLVWHDPALAGRIAYDTSFELLTEKQLTALNTLGQAVIPGQPDPLKPYTVLVLYPVNKTVNRILLTRTHATVRLKNKRVVVAIKAAT